MKKLALHWQILIALLLATAAGHLTGTDGSLLGIRFFDVYNFIGTLFLNALKMIIVPLIAASIICGVANIASDDNLGRLGGKTPRLLHVDQPNGYSDRSCLRQSHCSRHSEW